MPEWLKSFKLLGKRPDRVFKSQTKAGRADKIKLIICAVTALWLTPVPIRGSPLSASRLKLTVKLKANKN